MSEQSPIEDFRAPRKRNIGSMNIQNVLDGSTSFLPSLLSNNGLHTLPADNVQDCLDSVAQGNVMGNEHIVEDGGSYVGVVEQGEHRQQMQGQSASKVHGLADVENDKNTIGMSTGEEEDDDDDSARWDELVADDLSMTEYVDEVQGMTIEEFMRVHDLRHREYDGLVEMVDDGISTPTRIMAQLRVGVIHTPSNSRSEFMRGPPPPGGPSRGWRGATNVGMDVRHVDAQSYPWSRPTPTSGFGIRPNSVSGFQVRQSFRQCGAANVNQSTRASSHALINSAGRGGPNGAQLRHQPYARTTRSTTAQNHIHPHLHPQQRFGTILQPETNNGAPVRSTPLNSLTHLTFRADSTNSSIPTTVAVKSKRCKRGVVTKSSASSNPVPTPIAGHQRPAVNFVTLDIPLGEYPIRPRTTRVLLPGQALQARIRPEFRKVSMVTTPKYFRLPKIPDMVTDPPLPKLRPAEFVREDVPEVQLPPAFFWLLDSKNPNYLLYVDDSRFPMDNLGPWEQQWLNNAFRADKGGLTRPTPARILGIPR